MNSSRLTCSVCGTTSTKVTSRACRSCTSSLRVMTEYQKQWDKRQKDIQRKCEEKYRQLEVAESKLQFLRMQFDTSGPPNASQQGDAVIIVQGKSLEPLHVHKFILSSRSPVFCKMFSSKMREEQSGTVHIEDATLPVMRAVLNFCYNAEINFSEEVRAEEVLGVAHKYDIALLHKTCEEHLIRTLNKGNLSGRLELSKRFDAASLEAAARKYSISKAILEALLVRFWPNYTPGPPPVW